MNDTFFHINGCVYQLVVTPDGDTKHHMRQVNNPFLVKNPLLGSFTDKSVQEIKNILDQKHEYEKDYHLCFMYPVDVYHPDVKYNFLCLSGTTLKGVMPDREQVVMRPAEKMTEDEAKAFWEAVLTPKFHEVPFELLVPVTNDYMFDLSISHVPGSAIIQLKEGETREHRLTEEDLPDLLNGMPGFHAVRDPKAAKIGQEVQRQSQQWVAEGKNIEDFKVNFDVMAEQLSMTTEELDKYIQENVKFAEQAPE